MTAAALLALPFLAVGVLGASAAAVPDALLGADLSVLAVVALRAWSPLAVLAAAVLGIAATAVAWFAVAAADTCGASHGASLAKGVGATALALGATTWGVRGGRRVYWALPLGLAAAAVWIVALAHALPGGSGGCFE